MNIKELFEEVGANVRSYSGRGMFGKNCLAISGDLGECQEWISEVAQLLVQTVFDVAMDANTDEEREEADNINFEAQNEIANLFRYKQDSLGLDVVTYWPDIDWED